MKHPTFLLRKVSGIVSIGCLLLTIAAGCSDNKKESTNDAGTNSDLKATLDQKVPTDLSSNSDQKSTADLTTTIDQKVSDSTTSTVLEGTWKSPCMPDSDGDDYLNSFVFTGNSVRLITEYFEGQDQLCDQVITFVQETRATFSIGAAVSAVGGAKEIDFTVIERRMKPLAAGAVTYLNDNSYCGHTDWALNTEKIFKETPCDADDLKSGDIFLDIFKISVDGKTLQTGNWDMNTRPTSLEKTYAKQ